MPHATRPEEHAVRRLVDRVWNDLGAVAHELIAPECPGLDGTGPESVLDWHDAQQGAYGPVPPTGRSATWSGAAFVKFDAKGRVCDVWSVNDLFGLVQQLGVRIEPPG